VLKTELLDALHERYPAGLPNPTPGSKKQLEPDEYIPIPDDSKDVALAVPVDVHNIEKGWRQLGRPGEDALGLKESPKTLGIKDGGVLAFRFRGEDERDGDDDEEEAEGEEVGEDTQKFVVEWPSYDETYGEPEPDREDMDMDEK
jgi:hypothetical protein